MPVSSRFARKVPSISPTVGKFCTPAKPASRTSLQESSACSRNGSVPQTPASTGVSRTIGSTSRRHLHDDRVGVAVGQEPGQRAAPRHAVAARVVDDDQVRAARLGALGREPVPAPRADDHAARASIAQLRARLVARHRPPRGIRASFSAIAIGERRVVDVVVELDQLDLRCRRVPRAGRRTGRHRPRGGGTAGPRASMHRHALQRHEQAHRRRWRCASSADMRARAPRTPRAWSASASPTGCGRRGCGPRTSAARCRARRS